MYESFKNRAEGVGAEVFRFSDRAGALDFILDFLRSEGVSADHGQEALWANGNFLAGHDRLTLAQQLPGLEFSISRELAAECRVGISEADWALADTGTLVADQSAIEQRLVSTLPPVHIALVKTESILADKSALFSRISPATSRYIAFITGPSRTADIERVLTIGVHGPKRLVIVFVDDTEGARP